MTLPRINDYVLVEVVAEDLAPYSFVFVDAILALGGKWLVTVHHPETKAWHRCYRYSCSEEEVLLLSLKFGVTVYPGDWLPTGKYMHG